MLDPVKHVAGLDRQPAGSNVCSIRLLLVKVRGRYWNGAWGRLARRDIWLLSDGRLWRVRGRLGGDGGQEVCHEFADEGSAREMVDRIMKASAGRWRDLTEAVRQESSRRQLD